MKVFLELEPLDDFDLPMFETTKARDISTGWLIERKNEAKLRQIHDWLKEAKIENSPEIVWHKDDYKMITRTGIQIEMSEQNALSFNLRFC